MGQYPDDGTNFGNPPSPGHQKSGPSYTYDNQYKSDQGFKNRTSFGGIEGGADQNVNRYRDMGAAAANRGAYQTDLSQSNETRGVQMGALSLLDARARGAAPSAAEISGRAAMDRALANRVAVAGGARGGPMQQAAALHRAGQEMAGEQQQMTQGIQAGRANEMATASGQLATAAQGVRSEDLGGAQLQQQSELAQRQLNQQAQMGYEKLGFDVNAQQLAANLGAQGQANQMGEFNASQGQQASDFAWNKGMQVVGTAAGAATGGAGAAIAAAAKGGKIHDDQPYLVGEHGPELVVPDKPGFVLTALQTAAQHGVPPTAQQLALMPASWRRAAGGPVAAPVPLAAPPVQMQNFASVDPMEGASAGELGMGGAGGLVSGTIGRENREVGRAIHPMSGGLYGMYAREEGGPVEGHGIFERFRDNVSHGLDRAAAGARRAGEHVVDQTKDNMRMLYDETGAHLRAAIPGREEGGPIKAEEHGFAAGFRAAISQGLARAHQAYTEATAPAPIVVATPRQPVPVAAGPTPIEKFVAPDAPSLAPAGSGPVTAPVKVAKVPSRDPIVPYVMAPVDAQGNAVATSTRACGGPMWPRRAEGGPVDAFMSEDERAAAGDPYARPPQTGAMGAPRGYAESRSGQSGYMFGPGSEVTHGYEKQDQTTAGQAPGTADWNKFGAPAANDTEPDWKRGGATTPAGAGAQGGNWLSKLLLGMSSGMAGMQPRGAR